MKAEKKNSNAIAYATGEETDVSMLATSCRMVWENRFMSKFVLPKLGCQGGHAFALVLISDYRCKTKLKSSPATATFLPGMHQLQWSKIVLIMREDANSSGYCFLTCPSNIQQIPLIFTHFVWLYNKTIQNFHKLNYISVQSFELRVEAMSVWCSERRMVCVSSRFVWFLLRLGFLPTCLA